MKFFEILFLFLAFGVFEKQKFVGNPTRKFANASARHIPYALALESRILARRVNAFHNEAYLVGFAETQEHRKNFFLVLVRVEVLRFASEIIEIEIGKNVERVVVLAKRRRADFIPCLAQTVVSVLSALVQLCERGYEKGNYQSVFLVAQIFERGQKYVEILVVFQKASGQRKIVSDVGNEKVLFHNEVVIDQFFESDDIEFVYSDRAFRDIEIIACAHSAEIAVVQNLERVDKSNLFRLARNVCHRAEEEIDWFIQRSFCVCRRIHCSPCVRARNAHTRYFLHILNNYNIARTTLQYVLRYLIGTFV